MPHMDLTAEEAVMSPALAPSRATVVTWLRVNLSITVFIGGLLSGGVTSLIAGVQVYDGVHQTMTELDQRVTAAHLAIEGNPERGVRGLRGDMADVDHRFNQGTERLFEMRRARDAEIAKLDATTAARDAELDGRLRVIEAQLRFFGARLGVR